MKFPKNNFKENKTKFINHKYYQLIGVEGEVSIAYFYFNADSETWGFGFNIADGGGFLPAYDLREDTSIKELMLTRSDRLSASESVYGFSAWLTCRKERTVMSSKDERGCIAELVGTFIKENKLDDPRGNYSDYLKHPRI